MKKILSLILVIALVAGIAVTGTMAYLTDRDNETNVFTVGDVNIELSEEYAQGSQLLPGVTITKKPTIENVGKNDAWVWLTYAVPTALAEVVDVDANWTAKGVDFFTVDIDGVGYTVFPLLYDKALAAGEKTDTAAFNSITLDASVDVKPDGAWYTVDAANGPKSLGWNNSNGAPVIYVNAYAIQTGMQENETVNTAYAKYVGQWGEDLSGVYGDVPAVKEVSTAAELADALATGGIVVLTADVDADADTTITIPVGVETTLNLNGKTLEFVTDDADKNDDGKLNSADNEVAIDVRGTLTVKNGTITTKHTGDNFKWDACTEVFYVAFNGTLNVEDATIENLGGSDMAYAIDVVNATNATLNIKDSTIKSTYIPVRIFNNSSGMNNVTIKDSTLDGVSRAFWVHIYSSKDNGNKGVKDATLNLDIFGNGNTFKASNPNRIIEFGFDDEINFNANGVQIDKDTGNSVVNVGTAQELQDAINNAEDDTTITLTGDIDLNDLLG